MPHRHALVSRPLHFGIPLLVLTALGAASAHAQAVQVAPFVGYRFGGDFYELATGRAVDADGAPSAGVLVDVRLPDGLQLEGLFSHQNARFVTSDLFGAQREWDVVVDHWQGGASRSCGEAASARFSRDSSDSLAMASPPTTK